jgi:hypothetical protein
MLFAACFGLALSLPQPWPHTCEVALSTERAALERLPLHKRIGPTLALIGRACGGLDASLARGAREASALPRAERSATLAKAQRTCAVGDAAAPARSVEAACAPGPRDPQGPILSTLDAGTYAFVRALSEKLGPKVSTNAELVLAGLALAVAHEGEKLPRK